MPRVRMGVMIGKCKEGSEYKWVVQPIPGNERYLSTEMTYKAK